MTRRKFMAAILTGIFVVSCCAQSARGQVVGGTAAPPLSLPANGSNAFSDCDEYWPEVAPFSSFTIDFLLFRIDFDRNPAFKSSSRIGGVAERGVTDFDFNQREQAPRFNLHMQIAPQVGISASYYRFGQASNTIVFQNSDPNRRVSSADVLNPDYAAVARQSEAVTGVGAFGFADRFRDFTEFVPYQVKSPQQYWFLDITPTQTFGAPITQLPPFPLVNSVLSGFADTLIFRSEFRMQVFDLDLTKTIELGHSVGTANLGLRYAYLSHNYFAGRTNAAGAGQIPGYDPFVSIIDDAIIDVERDDRFLVYGHNFRGTGPHFAFNLGLPMGESEVFHFYSKVGGTVLFGNRRETAILTGVQRVHISDISGQPPADLFYTERINSYTERNRFTVVPAGEVEVGIEIHFGSRNLHPVIRLGAMAQYWINAGNATNPNANLLLYGGNIGCGIAF